MQIHSVIQTFLPNSPCNVPSKDKEPEISGEFEGEASITKAKSPLTHALFVGGGTSSLEDDLTYFKENGAHIVVGTPGRLEEVLRKGMGLRSANCALISVKECEVVILDEADRLLELGFTRSLRNILGCLPKQRRTGLFSATMTEAVGELIRTGLRNPVRITVKVSNAKTRQEWRTPATLEIGALVVSDGVKMAMLMECLVKWAPGKKVIVYFATCKQIDYWYGIFAELGKTKSLPLYSLHGQQTPKRRSAVYQAFTGALDEAILLTTDVAARGLDIANVDLVIQVDPPTDPKMFAHRCGRAGRAGRAGKAIVFLTEAESTFLEFMQLRKVNIVPVSCWSWGGVTSKKVTQSQPIEMMTSTQLSDLHDEMKQIILKDRDLLDKSILAFTSYIRSYGAHELAYIFQVKNLKWMALIRMFGLLRVPNMPELRKADLIDEISAYESSLNVIIDEIPYADAVREKARQLRIVQDQAKVEQGMQEDKKRKPNSITAAWSEQHERKRRRLERREKRARRKAAIETLKKSGQTYTTPNQLRRERKTLEGVNGSQNEPSGAESDSDVSMDSKDEDSDLDNDYAELKREKRYQRKEGNLKGFSFDMA
jgi:ATP-dependent RNA helicase DDX55/SPB4